MEPWKTIAVLSEDSYRIFSVRRETAQSQESGRSHDFVIIDAPDWVNVIPLTPEGGVVFVRQHRQGTRLVTLEIPGGMVHRGEAPADAGARELLEETGYAGTRARVIGAVHPNPAIQTNLCHTLLVEDAVPVADPTPDPGEELDIVVLPFADVGRLIREGTISHALVVAAFHHLSLLREGASDSGPAPSAGTPVGERRPR